MKKLLALVLAMGLSGCGDFVDDDGNTSIRQIAQGLQSLGDRVAEMGEAIERDAGVLGCCAVAFAVGSALVDRRGHGAQRTHDHDHDRNGHDQFEERQPAAASAATWEEHKTPPAAIGLRDASCRLDSL